MSKCPLLHAKSKGIMPPPSATLLAAPVSSRRRGILRQPFSQAMANGLLPAWQPSGLFMYDQHHGTDMGVVKYMRVT